MARVTSAWPGACVSPKRWPPSSETNSPDRSLAPSVWGMELVGAYMTDPLWISEYTVYLEQNFCVGHNDHHCVDMVQRHFPPMHSMAMAQFFVPQEICDTYFPACGGTKPPRM